VIGRVISHYRVIEKIGKGGMSVVYKARDLKLDRPVALKFLPPHLAECEDAVARFLREARAISALNHPHIATIYELGQTPDGLFLVLEYLPGGTVRSLVQDLAAAGERLSPRQLFEFAIGIAEGLAHAHRQGIIHRDVKTDNVMLTAEGSAKLTDFGLAKLQDGCRLTRSGSIIGTASYMSPEQARGEELDERSDIFSFGVVLYEMATGQLPFRGPHEVAVLSEVLYSTAPCVSRLRGDLPSAFGGIVRKAIEKKPERRYQSTSELLADLRAAAGDLGNVITAVSADAETKPLTPLPGLGKARGPILRALPRWLRVAILMGLLASPAIVVPSFRAEIVNRLIPAQVVSPGR
jgi:serine/threonine protein kinase